MVYEGMQQSLDALYISIILQSWIAFESFAADLWVDAIDKGPKFLANKVAISKDLKRPDESITPAVLFELEYDARKEMGLFLRETRRVSFQKLSDIKNTYEIAFGIAASKLFSATDGGSIFALSSFRNVFAHRAGRADKDFVAQMKRFPEYRHIQRDEQIALDGEMASKLRNSAANMALALLLFVDNLIANPTPQYHGRAITA